MKNILDQNILFERNVLTYLIRFLTNQMSFMNTPHHQCHQYHEHTHMCILRSYLKALQVCRMLGTQPDLIVYQSQIQDVSAKPAERRRRFCSTTTNITIQNKNTILRFQNPDLDFKCAR